jgi:hypothetical protein
MGLLALAARVQLRPSDGRMRRIPLVCLGIPRVRKIAVDVLEFGSAPHLQSFFKGKPCASENFCIVVYYWLEVIFALMSHV